MQLVSSSAYVFLLNVLLRFRTSSCVWSASATYIIIDFANNNLVFSAHTRFHAAVRGEVCFPLASIFLKSSDKPLSNSLGAFARTPSLRDRVLVSVHMHCSVPRCSTNRSDAPSPSFGLNSISWPRVRFCLNPFASTTALYRCHQCRRQHQWPEGSTDVKEGCCNEEAMTQSAYGPEQAAAGSVQVDIATAN